MTGFQTRKACEAEAVSRIAAYVAANPAAKAVGLADSLAAVMYSSDERKSYHCLPDTVDPRGPKAK